MTLRTRAPDAPDMDGRNESSHDGGGSQAFGTLGFARGTLQARATSVQAEITEALVEARDLAAAVDDALGAAGPHRVR